MPSADIKILRKDDPGPAFPGRGDPAVPAQEHWEVAIIEDGMLSGKGSVGIGFFLGDGTYVMAQTSLAVFANIVVAARAAFPDQFADGPLAASS
jgi:hypothetical protein